MSKKNKNVLKESADALNTIADELDTLNSYLYGIGVELTDLNSKIESLEVLLWTIVKEPVRVIVDTESLLATIKKASEKVKPEEVKPAEMAFKPFG